MTERNQPIQILFLRNEEAEGIYQQKQFFVDKHTWNDGCGKKNQYADKFLIFNGEYAF